MSSSILVVTPDGTPFTLALTTDATGSEIVTALQASLPSRHPLRTTVVPASSLRVSFKWKVLSPTAPLASTGFIPEQDHLRAGTTTNQDLPKGANPSLAAPLLVPASKAVIPSPLTLVGDSTGYRVSAEAPAKRATWWPEGNLVPKSARGVVTYLRWGSTSVPVVGGLRAVQHPVWGEGALMLFEDGTEKVLAVSKDGASTEVLEPPSPTSPNFTADYAALVAKSAWTLFPGEDSLPLPRTLAAAEAERASSLDTASRFLALASIALAVGFVVFALVWDWKREAGARHPYQFHSHTAVSRSV